MAVVHKGASLVPGKTELVAPWMADQRWYAGKGHVPQLRRVGGFRFEDPEGRVGMETMLLVDDAATPPVVYQVPLTYRDAPLEGAEKALIGTMEHSVLGTRWVYDGPHDPAYVSALVGAILGGGVSDEAQASVGSNAVAHGSSTGRAEGQVASAAVLTGEQSNTSIIARMTAPDGGLAEPVDRQGVPHAPARRQSRRHRAVGAHRGRIRPRPDGARGPLRVLGLPHRGRSGVRTPRLRPGVHPGRRGRVAGGPRRRLDRRRTSPPGRATSASSRRRST